MSKEIKLQDGVRIKAGNTKCVIYIQHRDKKIMITQTVLKLMVKIEKNVHSDNINDKILKFLQCVKNE